MAGLHFIWWSVDDKKLEIFEDHDGLCAPPCRALDMQNTNQFIWGLEWTRQGNKTMCVSVCQCIVINSDDEMLQYLVFSLPTLSVGYLSRDSERVFVGWPKY